ncbi:MAG: glycosylase, partial [Planctomycetota bacterium]
MRRVPVTRTTQRILPDPRRVIVKPHLPGEETYTLDGKSRVKAILERVLAIPNPQVASVLEEVLSGFAPRHRDFERVLQNHFHLVDHHLGPSVRLSEEQRLLIGAYFSHEYSI